MTDILKGNFEVKRKVELNDKRDEVAEQKQEYRKKALESIGGSMVFVERERLYWEETDSANSK